MADDTKTPDKPKAKPRESTRKEYTLKADAMVAGKPRKAGDKVMLRQDQATRLQNAKIV